MKIADLKLGKHILCLRSDGQHSPDKTFLTINNLRRSFFCKRAYDFHLLAGWRLSQPDYCLKLGSIISPDCLTFFLIISSITRIRNLHPIHSHRRWSHKALKHHAYSSVVKHTFKRALARSHGQSHRIGISLLIDLCNCKLRIVCLSMSIILIHFGSAFSLTRNNEKSHLSTLRLKIRNLRTSHRNYRTSFNKIWIFINCIQQCILCAAFVHCSCRNIIPIVALREPHRTLCKTSKFICRLAYCSGKDVITEHIFLLPLICFIRLWPVIV